MAGLWRFSFFFCRSNCLREVNSILFAQNHILSWKCNTRRARQEDAREVLFVKPTFANVRSVSEWLVIRPKLRLRPGSRL